MKTNWKARAFVSITIFVLWAFGCWLSGIDAARGHDIAAAYFIGIGVAFFGSAFPFFDGDDE